MANGKAENFNTVHDVPLHYTGRGKGGKGDAAEAAPPDAVIQEIDAQELNRVFVRRYVSFVNLLSLLPLYIGMLLLISAFDLKF